MQHTVHKQGVKMSKVQTSLRLDETKLKEAKEILTHLGLNFSEAVNIFTNMIVAQHGLPFNVAIPNAETAKAMKEVRESKNLESISLDDLKDGFNEENTSTSQELSEG